MGILLASGQINAAVQSASQLYLGTLSPDGSVRHIPGILPIVAWAQEKQIKTVFEPVADAREAALMQGVAIYPVETLGQLIAHLNAERQIEPYRAEPCLLVSVEQNSLEPDLAAIRGQEHVKRALEVAAGGHNLVLSGSPGSGRRVLARCLPSLLPRMSFEEALDVTRIYSVSGMLPTTTPLVAQRPFRALHPPVSHDVLVGDGSQAVLGEMSLAHRGVLFLDELAECGQGEQDIVCQALEEKVVSIARAQETVVYPASFMLIASMRPCPCGFVSDPIQACTCSARSIARYQKRMHARLLDHIDMQIEVPRVDFEKLADRRSVETSEMVRSRVEAAREQQRRRLAGTKVTWNAAMGPAKVRAFCQMDASGEKLLSAAVQQLHLSARASQRTLKLARTIADLADNDLIKANHLAEAIQYRLRLGT